MTPLLRSDVPEMTHKTPPWCRSAGKQVAGNSTYGRVSAVPSGCEVPVTRTCRACPHLPAGYPVNRVGNPRRPLPRVVVSRTEKAG
ncbi:hypothetical protein SGM_0545 [Streptomyces griseoaurantiacus M045]|uniref:Uncharacterized protein n=1 Tax=Streptomyces griseoaurantiacus M045 TaxID=996637 RepID=F3NB11_9ACTN|nr:hypothetical protein SGM_0545 [Streptomyces griseoaurantiacus M045]